MTRSQLQLMKLGCQIQLGEVDPHKVTIVMSLAELRTIIDLCTQKPKQRTRKRIKDRGENSGTFYVI